MSVATYGPGFNVFFGDDQADSVSAIGTRTVTGMSGFKSSYRYTYGVNTISTLGGDDSVSITDMTAIDPAGINPVARQVIDLGSGNDRAYVSSLTAATIYGGAGNDTLSKVDLRSESSRPIEEGTLSAPASGPAPDGLAQDANWTDFDIFSGGDGNDTITAGNGPDWVYGDAGNDTIFLGAGNNVLFAGSGDDIAYASGVYYNSVAGSGGSFFATNILSDSSNAYWMGDGNDTVTIRYVRGFGTGLVATVNGEAGNDVIYVYSYSNSWITGGDGADVIRTFAEAKTGNIFGYPPAETADTLYGDAGDDHLGGDYGDDLIIGGTGRDWIFDGHGNDNLYGGPGSGVDDAETDRFSFSAFFSTVGFNRTYHTDNVFDFQPASRYAAPTGSADVIDVAGLLSDYGNGYYDAGNPFTQGELRLQAAGAGSDTALEINDSGTWRPILVFYGVATGDLNTLAQADISGGLAAKTGGDFLWFTG